MTQNQTTAAIVLGLIFWAYGLPADVSAKPKQSSAFGCTTEDLNTGFGSSCVRQAEQDVMQGNSYLHVMICEGGQQKCCTINGSGQILNCRRPAGSAAMRQPLQQLTPMTPRPGSIQSRGVEGAEDVGEETPVPSWLTESWLKEHEGAKPSK